MIEVLQRTAVASGPFEFWILFAILTAVAVFSLRRGLDGFWRLRLVVDTPTARVRSAPQGYVELTGLALPRHAPIDAPLTGLPCVWYRYRVEERRRSGKSSHWVTVERGEADRPFLLDDGTGRCLVDATGAELHCRAKDTWYGSHQRAPKPQKNSWLRVSGRYRLTEERIVDQDPIYLLGRLQTPRRGSDEKDRLTRGLLTAWKRDPERMAGFDRDGDGEISLSEWEDARTRAQHLAEQSEERLRSEPPLSRVGRAGDPRRPFVIATLDADSLLRRLRLRAFGGTSLFLLLASGVVFAVIARVFQA